MDKVIKIRKEKKQGNEYYIPCDESHEALFNHFTGGYAGISWGLIDRAKEVAELHNYKIEIQDESNTSEHS